MENKSKNAIIALLGLVVLVLIGYICYDKIASAAKKDSENHNTEEIPQVQIPSVTKAEVSNFIDQYYFVKSSPEENLFTVTIDDNIKKNLALRQAESEIKQVDCSTLTGYTKIKEGTCTKNEDSIYTHGRTISYNSLNNKYQYLFGKDNVLEKADFTDLPGISTWEYDSNQNQFLATYIIGGVIAGPHYTTYEIKNYSQLDDKLIVNVGYVYMKPTGEMTSDYFSILSANIGGKEVTYTELEVQAENFRTEFLDQYLDKLDTYRFTFQYEDHHFVLVSVAKI